MFFCIIEVIKSIICEKANKKKEDIMGNVKRIYVEKKDDYAVKGRELQEDIANYLSIANVN